MALTLISSARAPETVELYDEGWENYGETDEEKKACKESRIFVKHRVDAGDQEKITGLTYQAFLEASEADPTVQEMKTKFNLEISSIATAAVMITGVKGALFTDPDSSEELKFQGSLQMRLDSARRLPYNVVAFVDGEVARMNRNPFPTKATEKPLKRGSGRASTKD